jgi:hypothetical protein
MSCDLCFQPILDDEGAMVIQADVGDGQETFHLHFPLCFNAWFSEELEPYRRAQREHDNYGGINGVQMEFDFDEVQS